jgi:uncharacterized protein (TIRG00374 family)
MKFSIRKILLVMLFGVFLYGGFSVWRGVGKMGEALALFHWWSFFLACALAFGNYVLRFFKWEFYLARLNIKGITKSDSFLTFLSGFVLTISPGKVGEAFKSLVLFETHGVPMTKTAPIVIAERVTDVLGIAVLIAYGSIGFKGGIWVAALGVGLVAFLLMVIMSRRLSLGIIDLVEKLPPKFAKLAPKLRHSYESLATLLAPRNLAFPTVISTAAWMMECMALYTILHGFDETTSVTLATFFYSTSTLAGALVAIAPGGLGVTETSLMAQMTEVGHIKEANATASMILVRFATLWFAVIVGFIALSILKRRYPMLLKEAKKELAQAKAEEQAEVKAEKAVAADTKGA